MATCTPIYGLFYPEGGDRPCDVGDTFCTMAASIEGVFSGFDAIIARTFTAIPMAKVSISTPQLINPNVPSFVVPTGSIQFDTILEDTDSMVDLSRSNTQIFVRRPGIYAVRLYFELGTSGSTLNTFQAYIRAAPPLSGPGVPTLPPNSVTETVFFQDPNLANSMSYSLKEFVAVTTIGSFFNAVVAFSGFTPGATTLLNRAEFDVEWMADL